MRHSTIYSLVPLFQQASRIVLLPLYTWKLATAQWGVVELTTLFIIATTQLVGVNLIGGMTRFYFEQRSERERAAVITSATVTLVVAAAAIAALCILLRDLIAPLLFSSASPEINAHRLPYYLTVTALTIPFALGTRCGIEYLQIHRRSALTAMVQMSKLSLEIGLKIYLLVVLEWGIAGVLVSVLIGEVLTSLMLSGWILIKLRPRIVWRVLQPMLRYALPLVPVGLCQVGLHQIDRLLLRALGPEDVAMDWVGIYGIGYGVGYLANAVLLTAFLQIWYPFVFAIRDVRDRAATVARVSTYAVVAVAGATLGLVLFGREAVLLLTPRGPGYHGAYVVVPWVAAGYVFWALYSVSQMPLYIAKRTRPIMWINFVALAINILLNTILIPALGYQGAALATLGTFGSLAGMGMLASRGVSGVPFELGRLARTLAVLGVCVAAAIAVDDHLPSASAVDYTVAVSLKLIVGLLLLLVLWRWVLRADEREMAGAWVMERLGRRKG